MKHVFYEKMPHSAKKWNFTDDAHKPEDVDWCVTEKCHGANFSFLCDGDSVSHARRNDILTEKEKFFGYKTMADKYQDHVLNAYNLILNDEELMNKYVSIHNDDIKNSKYEIAQVSIYGEMFGGFFPQQNKSKDDKAQNISDQNKLNDNNHKPQAMTNKNNGNNNNKNKNGAKNPNNSNKGNNPNNRNETNNPNPNQRKRRNRRRRRGKRGGKKNNKNNDNQNTNDNDGWITKGQKVRNMKQDQNKDEVEEKKENKTKTKTKDYVVQREILYCPYIEFYAFDIAVTLKVDNNDNSDENNLEIRKYMDYCDAMQIFKACKFFYAKPLFIGTFEDCCKYNYEFKSTIPNLLGLQPLHKEYGDNLAEGVIVKPMKNVYYTLGDDHQTLHRAIVKLKHPFFQERIGDFKRKFKEKRPQNDKKKNVDNNNNIDKDKDPLRIEMVLEMMNLNRYQSVISKHGNPEKDNHDFYVEKMVTDIYEDIVNIEEEDINEWWENRILKREQLLKYVEMKLQKKAMEIILNQNI